MSCLWEKIRPLWPSWWVPFNLLYRKQTNQIWHYKSHDSGQNVRKVLQHYKQGTFMWPEQICCRCSSTCHLTVTTVMLFSWFQLWLVPKFVPILCQSACPLSRTLSKPITIIWWPSYCKLRHMYTCITSIKALLNMSTLYGVPWKACALPKWLMLASLVLIITNTNLTSTLLFCGTFTLDISKSNWLS